MDRPIEVDLPHKLGKDEAKRRIASNVHRLKDAIPGGATQVDSRWEGDELHLDISAMGQTIATTIAVEEAKVRLRLLLPPLLAMFAGPIEAALSRKGGDLLLEDKHKKG